MHGTGAPASVARRGSTARRAGREVVEHDGRVAGLRELDDDVRADVAGAAGDEDGVGHGRVDATAREAARG